VWGTPDADSVRQIRRCSETGSVAGAALMADHHKGYSMPIGGVVAYRDTVSPSGVGYDIGCGNKAVATDLLWADVAPAAARILDRIADEVSFGLGSRGRDPRLAEHPLFSDERWSAHPGVAGLRERARSQLGSVGSGNHYVDLLVDDATGALWVANHFGSRGLGHGIASGFLNLAAGRSFTARAPGESMDQPPALLAAGSAEGEAYIAAMGLAGDYARAGRDHVMDQVLGILGAWAVQSVHNHHNYAWREEHGGEPVWVVRKGATPLWPGDVAFIGGSMTDVSVVVEGVDGPSRAPSLCSAPHGAGRVMSRSAARGDRKGRRPGRVTPQMMRAALEEAGVQLRGGGLDESPFVYRRLLPVLAAHDNLRIRHVLRPVGVVMAGAGVVDPYKD
jgi:tRNA-splicing ligase RtcB